MAYTVNLPFLPERTEKPRKSGLTMVMDKGISTRQAEDMMETAADYIDSGEMEEQNLVNKITDEITEANNATE